VILDGDAVHGGEFIVQAKRYRKVVPANDVRALVGVMHDKRASHSIFVTTAWFSDDGRRFAITTECASSRVRSSNISCDSTWDWMCWSPPLVGPAARRLFWSSEPHEPVLAGDGATASGSASCLR
jgi:hypothetical protein